MLVSAYFLVCLELCRSNWSLCIFRCVASVTHFFIRICLLNGGHEMGWIILGVLVALVFEYIVASKFSEIAEMKGHSGRTYFWYTFLFGFCGMLMVVALPNVKEAESGMGTQNNATVNNADIFSSLSNRAHSQSIKTEQTSTNQDTNAQELPITAEINNGLKICPKCGLSQRVDRTVCWSCGQRFDN